MSNGHIVIVGAGIAGLMSALEVVKTDVQVSLCCVDWKACSTLMAEGGINAALDADNDSVEKHAADTMLSTQGIASTKAIRNLAAAAPDIVNELYGYGVQFSMNGNSIAQRPFGGSDAVRTCYAGEETGKQILAALLDAVRVYVKSGAIRLVEGRFAGLVIENGRCAGAKVYLLHQGVMQTMSADAVIMACGGVGGVYSCPTSAFHNTGDAAGILFKAGVAFSNLEFVQFHPTTVRVGCRRILISESARAEGGRMCTLRNGQPHYFLEEMHAELGQKANLLSRDITARACYFASQTDGQVYLDLRQVPKKAYKGRLSDTLEDCHTFLKLNPAKDLIPVEPGVHYFMGGIQVDEQHRTNIAGLYAAGECCAQYHGANRLGGNSLLGAAFGGKVAAQSALSECGRDFTFENETKTPGPPLPGVIPGGSYVAPLNLTMDENMGIVRNQDALSEAYDKLSFSDEPRVVLARAMIKSALERKESRGAHYRSDFPETDQSFQKASIATFSNGQISVEFQAVE